MFVASTIPAIESQATSGFVASKKCILIIQKIKHDDETIKIVDARIMIINTMIKIVDITIWVGHATIRIC